MFFINILKNMITTHYVYWIKRKTHTDIFTEGYVGISNNPFKRFNNGHKYTKNKRLKHALSKYSDIEIVIVHEKSSEKECSVLEEQYRPKPNIGWNLNKGGDMPPQHHRTKEVCKKISNTHKLKNTNPYNKLTTHSAAAVKKRVISMTGRAWYYDPATFKSGLFHIPPNGWIEGRKQLKPKIPAKKRNKDYYCNVSKWEIVTPEGVILKVHNLKDWCKENNFPYLATFKNENGWKGWKVKKINN